MSALALGLEELREFLSEVFPQIEGEFLIEDIGPMRALARLPVADKHLRPGGTVSGPSMMALVDLVFYAAVLAQVGREPLTVTSNLNINFLRKPPLADLYAEARILKLGRRLVTGDAIVFGRADGPERPLAHASLTYARA